MAFGIISHRATDEDKKNALILLCKSLFYKLLNQT